ncbi:MAG: DUF1223 domain-containing protein [Dokdonella sp.]|uniref:DUF1223 domain-containing protein n=1 Tax=Dokdonella sp. TaxID=2291710 RepID=UPI0025B7C055|nr:DUF1223 domain-containing protein [Dokdonella sp.]MBZ0222451.1 DUF1223 domain-containing protein [Dokdonella sp.]
MRCGRVLMLAVVLAGVSGPADAQSDTRPVAVIELFTSQGCSSCPPADRLLGELAKNASLITLSLSVDYWDHLGWKDSLASPRHTKRQWAYSRSQGTSGVYTPQAIINGVVGVVGSNRKEIEAAIARTRDGAMTVPVRLALDGDAITVSVADGKNGAAPADLWLCGVTRSASVEIRRGENRGRNITYVNVGRHWAKVGTWSGKSATWSVPASTIAVPGVDSVIAILQRGSDDKPGPILGAAAAMMH